MAVLDATSFVRFEEFSLRARFAQRSSGDIAPEFRDRLRPLTPAAAASLAVEAMVRCADAGEFEIAFRSDDSPGIVQARLRELALSDAAPVVVWWDSATALLTEWGVFASHWGAFCYPAADNVCVWPLAGQWTLCYRRYEVMQFTRTARSR